MEEPQQKRNKKPTEINLSALTNTIFQKGYYFHGHSKESQKPSKANNSTQPYGPLST